MRTELKLFRVKRNLRQDDMAEKCGVSRVTYSFIENGKRGGSAKFWSKLQNVFSVPDEQMYGLMKIEERE